jgi:predicted TIM-barrel fold metal-dependent hydrolase
MTRRGLFGLLAAAAPLRAQPRKGIVDAHVHFYDPTRPQGVPWPGSKTDKLYRPMLPGPWEKMVRPMGVAGVIVVEASPWLEDNQWVLDLAKEFPVIVGFVGHLEPGQPEFRANLARFARNPIFRGIRLNENMLRSVLNEQAVMDDLRRVLDAGLAVDVLGNGPMLFDVAKVSDKLPELRIVVDHLPIDAPAGALAALKGRANVYAKVSGAIQKLKDRAAMDEVFGIFGPQRVIYASNWPVCERLAPYSEVFQAVRDYFDTKGPAVAEKFFRTNSEAAYRWLSRS